MIDVIGLEFNDDLSHFLEWYLKEKPGVCIPINEQPVFFVEDVTGVVIYRHKDYQVQLFTCAPNGVIPSHTHPNVDSFEVSLWGMEFSLEGKKIISIKHSLNSKTFSYLPIRVLPKSEHGAKAGVKGGCFLSIQRWLNGVKPTSVGNDWAGDLNMGNNHSTQIKTKEIVV